MSWGFEFADGLNQRKHLGKVYKTDPGKCRSEKQRTVST